MKNSISFSQKSLLVFFSFYIALTFLAIAGIFYKPLIIGLSFAAMLAIIYFFLQKIHFSKSNLSLCFSLDFLKHKSKKHWVVLFILGVSLFHTLLYHNFSLGRDETGYQAAGAKLAQEGKLYFNDLFTRPFHPFREVEGMPENTFTSQFLPGYNAYLALWYMVFGIQGMLISNLPLISISLLSIYKITQILAKKLLPQSAGAAPLLSLLFITTFYSYFWFFRRTNSENLFMASFWLGSWLFLDGVIKKNVWKITIAVIPFSFLFLIRGEGLLYLIFYLFLSLASLWSLKIKKKIYFYSLYLFPLLTISFYQFYSKKMGGSYLADHFHNLQRTIVNNFLTNPKILTLIILLGLAGNLLNLIVYLILKKKVALARVSASLGILIIIVSHWIFHYYFLNSNQLFRWANIRTSFVFNVFSGYLLLCFLIIIALGLLKPAQKIFKSSQKKFAPFSLASLQNRLQAKIKTTWINLGKKSEKNILFFLFILILPSFVFLLDPFVALDQPWFMRRFYTVFLPFIFILSGLFIYRLPLQKKYIQLIALVLISANLILSAPLIFYREHYGINKELKAFTEEEQNSSPQKNLYLMSPGWRWQQWAYQLHYLYGLDILPNLDRFSPKDFASLLKQYKKILIISTAKKEIFPSPFVKHPITAEKQSQPILYFKDQKLNLKKEIILSYPELEITCPLTSYILNDDQKTYDYSRFNEKCFKKVVPSKIKTQKIKLFLYELRN